MSWVRRLSEKAFESRISSTTGNQSTKIESTNADATVIKRNISCACIYFMSKKGCNIFPLRSCRDIHDDLKTPTFYTNFNKYSCNLSR